MFNKPVSALAFSNTGEVLMACSLDNKAKLAKFDPFRAVSTFSAHTDTINDCLFTH